MTRGDTRTIVFGGPAPEIVCICATGAWQWQVQTVIESVTLAGGIVVHPTVFASLPPVGSSRRGRLEEKHQELQFRRIDIADRVVVIKSGSGAIGALLQKQVDYAEAQQIPVSYQEFVDGQRLEYTETDSL